MTDRTASDWLKLGDTLLLYFNVLTQSEDPKLAQFLLDKLTVAQTLALRRYLADVCKKLDENKDAVASIMAQQPLDIKLIDRMRDQITHDLEAMALAKATSN